MPTPRHSQILFIGRQAQMAFGVQSIDPKILRDNVVALAETARAFDIPAAPTTVETEGRSDPMYPELPAVFTEHKVVERSSMNS